MTAARARHTATMLASSQVLIVGGDDGGTAELYDPASGVFTALPRMDYPHTAHTATLLADGRVLIAGGFAWTGNTDALEIYDPATKRIKMVAAMSGGPRQQHQTVLLRDGSVLITGGADQRPTDYAERYISGQPRTELTPRLTIPRSGHRAALLQDGRVLLVGGRTVTPQGSQALVNSAEIYTPAGDK